MLSIVIPARNEEHTIFDTIDDIDCTSGRLKREIIVVDDRSADCTALMIKEAAEEFFESQVRSEYNFGPSGYGHAVRLGFQRCEGELVTIMMADGSDNPDHLQYMKIILESSVGGFDMVIGSRYMKGGRQVGGPIVKRALSRLAGLSLYPWIGVHDVTNAYRMIRVSKLRELNLESEGFELNLEITAKAHRAGWKICEIPVTWQDRRGGRSKFRLLRQLPKYLYWYAYALGIV